jgi:hypothetical protein
MSTDKVYIENDEAWAVSPEGMTASVTVKALLEKAHANRENSCQVVLPDGVKTFLSRGRMVIWVHQMSPRVCSLRWIAEGSKAPYGPDAAYRLVRIALPYVCVFVVFRRIRGGRMELTHKNECFFRNKPLTSLDDKLMYPALLNCSKFRNGDRKPLAWLCTQHLNIELLAGIAQENEYMRTALAKVLSCLWDTGFNFSSERHEGDSWFSETVRRKVDPRISSVKSWQEATEQDPLFAVDVPWLETGKSVREIADRIFDMNGAREMTFESARDLARLIFHSGKLSSRTLEGALSE